MESLVPRGVSVLGITQTGIQYPIEQSEQVLHPLLLSPSLSLSRNLFSPPRPLILTQLQTCILWTKTSVGKLRKCIRIVKYRIYLPFDLVPQRLTIYGAQKRVQHVHCVHLSTPVMLLFTNREKL